MALKTLGVQKRSVSVGLEGPVSSLSLLVPRAAKSVVTGAETSLSRVWSTMWILSGLRCFCLAPALHL